MIDAAPSPTEDMLCAWLAAGDRGDVDEFDRYLHPEVVVHAPLGLSTTGAEAEKAVWADGKHDPGRVLLRTV